MQAGRNSFCVHLTELSVSSLDSFCWNEVADRPNQIRLPEFSSRRFSCSCEDTGSLKLGDPHYCKCTFRYEAFDSALWGTRETPALVLILHCNCKHTTELRLLPFNCSWACKSKGRGHNVNNALHLKRKLKSHVQKMCRVRSNIYLSPSRDGGC